MHTDLVELFGQAQTRKILRLAKQRGQSLVSLLKLVGDLAIFHLEHLPAPAKNPAAVSLGRARWKGKTKEERTATARKAINARWARYREEKKGKGAG